MEKVIKVDKDKTLNDLKSGDLVEIIKVETNDRSKLRKLMAFGIFEGIELKLIQKFPVNIVQVGYTQVALDKEVSSIIKVK
jgi:Fe2+ transport system protein FeoA